MTVSSDYLAESPMRGIVRTLDGGRLMLRLLLQIGACVFTFVALMIWITPAASAGNEVMLYKLGISSMSVLAALGCWQGSLPPVPPTVEIDVAARELRLVREGAPAGARLIERCSFAQLADVELIGGAFIFWGKEGRLLAEVSLSNATAHATLLHALRVAGKLT